MRRSLHAAALTALTAALVFGPVPVVPCQEPAACPMMALQGATGGGMPCDLQPSLDCCVEHRTPPARDSGSNEAGQPAAAAALPAPAHAAPAQPAPPPRAVPPPAHGDTSVPLYTLHATLLI